VEKAGCLFYHRMHHKLTTYLQVVVTSVQFVAHMVLFEVFTDIT
jgi:hypothetical protein